MMLRVPHRRVFGSLLLSLGLAAAGCGDDDTPTDQGVVVDTGAGTDMSVATDMGSDAGLATLNACQRADLFMSTVDMGANTITLTNPTGADITIGGPNYQLCQGPGAYAALPAGVVPAGGSLTVDVPAGISLSTTNGTVALYNPGSFTTRDAMLDFVCWGDGGGTPRLNIAQRVGTDGTVLWGSGGCVPLGGASEVHLRNNSQGNSAADYRTTPETFTCMTAPPADAGVDAGPSDMGPSDMGVDAGPVVVLECDRGHLIIESVNTMTGEITLYNPTNMAITTNGDYQLCQGPGNYAAVPPLTFAAFGRQTFASPSAIDTGADQTLALYTSSAFGSRDAMADYMCWGTGGTRPRLSDARMAGADTTVLWDAGACTPANPNATVYRVPGTEGNSAADYTTTAPVPALSCEP